VVQALADDCVTTFDVFCKVAVTDSYLKAIGIKKIGLRMHIIKIHEDVQTLKKSSIFSTSSLKTSGSGWEAITDQEDQGAKLADFYALKTEIDRLKNLKADVDRLKEKVGEDEPPPSGAGGGGGGAQALLQVQNQASQTRGKTTAGHLAQFVTRQELVAKLASVEQQVQYLTEVVGLLTEGAVPDGPPPDLPKRKKENFGRRP
jgi:hypothetical protein